MGSRQFVFVRGIAPNTYLLFFHRGGQPQSYTLRDYSGGGKPRLIRGRDLPYRAEQLLKMAEDRMVAPEHDLDDHAFWHQIIMELNRHLVARRPVQGGRALPAGLSVQSFRYPVLALPELLHHGTKGSKTEDLASILHSQRSGDWVTWNCVRLLEGIDPAAWWPRLVELARAENPVIELAADPRDLPKLEIWTHHALPASQSAGLEQASGGEHAGWLSGGLEPEPDEIEVDLAISGRGYLVHADAKVGTDGSAKPTAHEARAHIAQRLDVLLEAAQERRPAYWMLVRQSGPDQAYAQALLEVRRRPSQLIALLPHRLPGEVEAACKNMALLRWVDVVQYLREFYEEVFKELDRRLRR